MLTRFVFIFYYISSTLFYRKSGNQSKIRSCPFLWTFWQDLYLLWLRPWHDTSTSPLLSSRVFNRHIDFVFQLDDAGFIIVRVQIGMSLLFEIKSRNIQMSKKKSFNSGNFAKCVHHYVLMLLTFDNPLRKQRNFRLKFILLCYDKL